jgi:hypothetical protein
MLGVSNIANPHSLALCGLKQNTILSLVLQGFFTTYLSTKCACVFGVLGYFHLFNHLPQRRTITSPIFTGDSNLLGSLRLERKIYVIKPTSMRNAHVGLPIREVYKSKNLSGT